MLIISDKYAFPLPLIMLALAKEIIKTSKVLKVLIFKIVKLKKPANKVDYITLKEMQKAINALVAAITNKMQL
jgi:hypothetical protein